MNESLKLSVEVRKVCGQEVSMVSVRDYKHKTLNMDIDSRNKVDEMKINLDDIPVPDIIHLHNTTRDLIHIDLMKSNLKISKLQSSKIRIENQLRKEKVENRAHQAQIKKLQTYLLLDENQDDKGDGTHKPLQEKEDTIQLLNKKLKIPATQLIQASKLSELEKEKRA